MQDGSRVQRLRGWRAAGEYRSKSGGAVEPEELVTGLPEVYSTAHDGIFHGGVVAALLDTTGSGAVLAGHDFDKGSRLTTISLSVQYLTVAPGEDLLAVGRCTRRGRSVHFAETRACGAASGKLVATGQVAVSIAGERPGVPWRASASSFPPHED